MRQLILLSNSHHISDKKFGLGFPEPVWTLVEFIFRWAIAVSKSVDSYFDTDFSEMLVITHPNVIKFGCSVAGNRS